MSTGLDWYTICHPGHVDPYSWEKVSMATLRSDAEVRQDVTDALICDIRIDATKITIGVVHNVVTLSGIVSSYYEKRTAGDLVRRIKGVRDVVNELRVMPAQPRSDVQITADVQAALARDVWVDERNIDLRVKDGVVYLSGIVDVYTAKSYAEGDAWSVPGVIDVVDNIVVAPRTTRTDTEIANEVRTDITHNVRLDPLQITVDVHSGVVFLRGSVSTLEQKWLADEVAWWTVGVRDVVNELQVESPGKPASKGTS